MVLGSSSVPALTAPGRKLRWAALLLLAVIAVVLALRAPIRPAGRSVRVATWLGAWLAALGLVSTGWSVDPRLTAGRSASFALLIVTAAALAYAAHDRPALPGRLLDGMLVGTCVAAAIGAVMVIVAHSDAIEAASTWYPARFKGLGENADTVSMLEGIAAPIALWGVVRARSVRGRALHLGAAVLLITSISASGSRGGLIAAFVGGIVLSLTLRTTWRRRLVVSGAVCAAMLAATLGTQIPQPLGAQSQPPASAPASAGGGAGSLPSPSVGATENQYTGRLTDELYRNSTEKRSLWSSSGRLEAWHGAIQQADARPLLGYGFGTENKVFIDRVLSFDGSYVENSFIGVYMQLGAVGIASFVALLGAVCLAALRAVRRADVDVPAPPLAAMVAAGLALMCVQSYAYSVGNVATVSFWIASFAALAAASATTSPRLVAETRRVREGSVATA
jgi:O-Antigen ligase